MLLNLIQQVTYNTPSRTGLSIGTLPFAFVLLTLEKGNSESSSPKQEFF